MADTFIRAPISIEITFNQAINIQQIVLDSKVDTKISNGFTVFSSVDSVKETTFAFQQIGKCINEKKTNSSHVYEFTRRNSAQTINEKLLQTETNKHFFSARSMSFLDAATALKITITRTLNSTAPCLKSIKVYGFLADNLQHLPAPPLAVIEKCVEIPCEFIDEITHEMIRNPIRLPSQKVIDKSTLDLLLDEQLKNNSVKKDPFTCVPFSSAYTPIIDAELKSRIDKFLLDSQGAKLVYKVEEIASGKIQHRPCKKRPLTDDAEGANGFMAKFAKKDALVDEKKSVLSKCNCCLNFKSEANDLYELEMCRHVYCRHCVKSMDKVCVVCKKTFENSQIVHFDRKMAKNVKNFV